MGYAINELDQYWQEIKGILRNMNKKQCMIWTTDNNGQIAHDDQNDANNTIGPWTYAHKCENGNGKKLAKYCNKHELCATNTHFIPKNRDKQHLATWHSYENGTYKQLDYIMISNNQKTGSRKQKPKELQTRIV